MLVPISTSRVGWVGDREGRGYEAYFDSVG